jgi:TatD DNase family protein
MTLIDLHAHLDQIENIDEVLARSSRAGVEAVLAVGVDLASCRKNLEIKQRCAEPKIFLGFGVHPGEIKPAEINATIEFIETNIREAVAIGEIGLDFWYRWVRKDEEKKQQQREVFAQQLALAKKYDLPVIVHSRGAWKECLAMVKDAGIRRALFHWYSGPTDVLQPILAEGFFISATPALAYSPQLREAVLAAPIEQTFIETDCPVFFKAGENDPGFRSSPADVFRTLTAYAQLKNIAPEAAAAVFRANAQKFFRTCPEIL